MSTTLIARYDMIQIDVLKKPVSNTDDCEVLVLPVHSRATRLISFLSRRETRLVSRDGGNLLLSATVGSDLTELK